MNRLYALRFLGVRLAVLGGMALAGAGSVAAQADPVSTSPVLVEQEEYRIQVDDRLGVRFYYATGLDENVIVRPDGRISLPLVHEIMVAGRTPAEIQKLLQEKYSAFLVDPEVSVIVREIGSRIFVGGEVNRAGEFKIERPTTVIQALWMAGGFRATAKRKAVLLIRHGPDGAPLVSELDMTPKAAQLADGLLMRPYDVVYVPKTRIAHVNKWVKSYIKDNLPISFGISFRASGTN